MTDDGERLAAILARGRANVTRRVEVLESAVDDLVQGALAEADRLRAAREAHGLAGTAGTFGLPEVSHLARELEELLVSATLDGDGRDRSGALVRQIAQLASAAPDIGEAPRSRTARTGHPPVLVVSASSNRRRQLTAELGARNRAVEATASAEAAAAMVADEVPAAAIIELNGDGDGPARLLSGALSRAGAPVLVITPKDDPASHLALIDAGVCAIMPVLTPAVAVVEALDRELTTSVGQQYRVMAVDDDPDILDVLRLTLERHRISVTTLDDPTRVLPELNDDPPDLLILDIDMPELNGVDLCRLIRANPRWRTLPVLFLSARRDPATIARVFDVGGDDYMTKPIIDAEVVNRVRGRLERAGLHRTLAETDPLTGLANRRRLEDRIAGLLSLSRRLDQPLSVAVLDVDHFKRVNDEYGHVGGDAVLRCLATHLTRSFRADSVIARIGGEEFVVGLLGTSPEQCAPRLAAVLGEFHSAGVDLPGGERIHVSVSAGVACHPRDALEFRGLYRQADDALRRAKESGRNRVMVG